MDSPASSSSQPTTNSVKGERKPIKLYSPYGAHHLIFQWQKEYEKNGAMDIFDTIRMIFGLIPEIKDKLEKSELFRESNITNYDWIRSVAKKFNKVATNYFKEHSKTGEPIKEDYASPELLRTICTRAYNRAVDDEKRLNRHYEAFSSQTYGETSYDRLQSIIEEIEVSESDIFMDLGSGVGQLVVQMAGGSKVKRASGIEVADLPSEFAKKLELEFKSMMKWYGRKYRPFQIHHGDFLDQEYRNAISEATIIFINNFAFQAELESNIKTKLLWEMKHGTRIITTKPYAPVNKNKQVTQRGLGDLSSILDVRELKRCPNPCSWTSNDVPYYLHVINRTKLEVFYEMQKNQAMRLDRSGTPSSHSSSMSREASRAPSRNGVGKDKNGDIWGPTTRRKWNQIVNEMEKSKGNNDGFETPQENSMGHSESEFHSPTPMGDAAKTRAANIADTIASVAGGTAATLKEFASPIKKRPRKDIPDGKVTVRGRPRKNTQPQEKKPRISQEAREGMDIMHQLTSEACNKAAEVFMDSSFVLTDVKTSITAPSPVAPFVEAKSERRETSEYPNLDRFLSELRTLYVKFLDSFNSEEFYNSMKARREGRTAEAQNQQITEEGVSLFKTTMKSYGVDLEKQRDKLTSAKQFITKYNNVLDLVHNLEREMSELDDASKTLIAQYSKECATEMAQSSLATALNDQSVASTANQSSLMNSRLEDFTQAPVPGVNSLTSSLQSALRNFQQTINTPEPNNMPIDQLLISTIAQNLSNSVNSPLFPPSGLLQPLANESTLPQTQQPNTNNLLGLTPTAIAELINMVKSGGLSGGLTDNTNALNLPASALYAPDTSRASTTAPPVVPTPAEAAASIVPPMSTALPPMSVAASNAPSTSKEQPPQVQPPPQTEPVTNGTNASKKARSRSVRVPSTKKTAPPKSVEDPVKAEEIDQKIKDIVQIALEVDKSAKSQAEKDRKARTSEKRSKEKNVSGSGGLPGVEQNSFENNKGTEAMDTSADENVSKKGGNKKNKTYPSIPMTSPMGQNKKRAASDIPASSTTSATTSVASSSMMSTAASAAARPIASTNSMIASSPLYQQLLTPTIATSSSTAFPMESQQQADFLNLLSQTTVKDNDAMAMLMRNMNNGTQLMNIINGFNYPNVVSSASVVNNNTELFQDYLSQLRRTLPVSLTSTVPSENDTSSVNHQSMP